MGIELLARSFDWVVVAVPAVVPDPGTGEAPPEVGEKLLTLLRWGAHLVTAACVGGILYTAGKMALSHRRGDDANVAQLGWVLAACILLGAAPQIVLVLV